MKGFRVVRVPVDVDAGEARLRLELEGRDPIRFTSRWAERRPEPVPAPAAPPKRARRQRTLKDQPP
jgi:hypothetical protein